MERDGKRKDSRHQDAKDGHYHRRFNQCAALLN
jgi:hypothetical protein